MRMLKFTHHVNDDPVWINPELVVWLKPSVHPEPAQTDVYFAGGGVVVLKEQPELVLNQL